MCRMRDGPITAPLMVIAPSVIDSEWRRQTRSQNVVSRPVPMAMRPCLLCSPCVCLACVAGTGKSRSDEDAVAVRRVAELPGERTRLGFSVAACESAKGSRRISPLDTDFRDSILSTVGALQYVD